MPINTQQLIKSFSDDIRQDHPGDLLSRGLSTAVAIDRQREKDSASIREQWNFLLAEGRQFAIDLIPDEEAVLLSQSRELYKAWTKFCQSLPPDQQAEMLHEIPSLKFLYQSVEKASTTWRDNRDGTKTGRLKSIFTRLVETFQSHSNIVSMIPTNDKYVTLLTGSISAIASACTNHEKLASGVSESLDELSHDMAYWNGLMALFPDQEMMQRYIMELYTVVFEFLTEIFTQWSKSSWKRFVKAFDEQAFHDLFTEKRKRIKSIENRMKRHADGAHMQAALTFQSDTGQRLSEIQLQVQTLTQVIRNLGIDVQSIFASKAMQISDNSADDPLNRLLEPPIVDQAGSLLAAHRLPAGSVSEGTPIRTSHATDGGMYNDRVQELVRLTSAALKVAVDIQIQRRLKLWASSLTFDRIWVQGPHDISHPSQNMLTTACMVGLANSAKIPCISYLGSLQSRDLRGTCSSPPELLLNMIKSFIVQLLLLQEDPNMHIVPPLSSFEQLMEPTNNDLDTALSLLQELQVLVPPYLLCVIESVQVLENRSDGAHTQNLRRVVREVVNLGQTQPPSPGDVEEAAKTVKVCFTSDGHADVLAAAAQAGFLEKIAYDTEDDSGEGEKLGSLWDDEAGSDG
ncbi:hypothetical protein PG993_015158 [Apiospora rasikravindrae]|uniref:DUF7708 domain-containing protein n=1 Tax=Apiospora rasikravindrae TaxID=990691 RepID=A0ABR1RR03_9PEZI